jgi:hypothetical protein
VFLAYPEGRIEATERKLKKNSNGLLIIYVNILVLSL